MFQDTDTHWSASAERRGLLGMRILLGIYRLIGRTAFRLCLLPVILVFYFTAKEHRRASRQYLCQLRADAASKNIILPAGLNTFRHFLHFGESILDKLLAWSGGVRFERIKTDIHPLFTQLATEKKGLLLLGSHFGNFELCRAIGNHLGQPVNAIVFTQHARRFNHLLQEISPRSTLNIIDATTLDVPAAILLKQKLDLGEWIAITADRVPIPPASRESEKQALLPEATPPRVTRANFLGKSAAFPDGPFILASILQCPVFMLVAFKEGRGLKICVELFSNPLELPRAGRAAALQPVVQRYADRLAHYCGISPLDWFNFYNFWK
jgi:predicted LPLAT superfamily acyltransferase